MKKEIKDRVKELREQGHSRQEAHETAHYELVNAQNKEWRDKHGER